MRYMNLIAAALTLAVAASATAAEPVKGDYVEVRTASVYAGPCHYNGELVSTGRDAILAWNIASGSHEDVNLAGVRAVAVVTSDANLIDEKAARKSELVIDAAATDKQAAAAEAMFKSQYGPSLGQVVKVRRSPIMFTREKDAYVVDAKGVASLNVQAMADEACCKQPSNVWYAPIAKLDARKVGFTSSAAYTGGAITESWARANENSAFYGSFSL
jgi:hypothetical protein